MKSIVLMMAVAFAFFANATERPNVDKTEINKTLMVQANPWFPVDMEPKYDLGGPNVPYRKYRGKEPWLEMLKTLEDYGVDAMYIEMCAPNGCPGIYRETLEAASKLKKMKIAAYFTLHTMDFEKAKAGMLNMFRQVKNDLRTHPRVMRCGGKPLITVYQAYWLTPEQWREMIAALEQEIGEVVILMGYSSLVAHYGLDRYEERLRNYVKEFDGVSTYCYSSEALSVQRFEAATLKKVMADFPGKVFQGSACQGYVVHYNMAGIEVHLSRNWRESVRLWLSAGSESLEMTNLFDHYENTLVYPCYEREDLLLRYVQYEMSKWRGSEFKKMKEPELVLCNSTSVLPGWTSLDFEVLGFPIDSDDRVVEVAVEVCDTAGKVLKTLGPQKIILDDFREVEFSLKSEDFVQERGVVPRLVYKWGGETRKMNYNPMTLICPSMRPHRLYWARSTKNAAKIVGDGSWTMDGVGPGGTRKPKRSGMATFSADFKSAGDSLRCGVKRDATEMYFMEDFRHSWNRAISIPVPYAGSSLHWYYLETQDEDGKKFQTLPIWETDGRRAKKVKMPICYSDGSIHEVEVEGARVPFYYWPCNVDDGRILVDISGLEHNAITDGEGFGGGHHDYTGYNFCHNGPILPNAKKRNLFRKDAEGRGYLEMSGENWITAFGGTAMPGAATYEISFLPKETGKRMGLFGTMYGNVSLAIEPDGTLVSARRDNQKKFEPDTFITSEEKVKFGEWNRVAYVYDLRTVKIYLNGKMVAEKACRPNHKVMPYGEVPNYDSHEFNNHLLIGCELKSQFTPINKFTGYLRDIRVYGRNLSEEELLQ